MEKVEELGQHLSKVSLTKADALKALQAGNIDQFVQAIDPAGEYGKVAGHLKNAVKQMQQAQSPGSSLGQQQQAKSGAAQSLADAARELEKLAQQMADAQQLAETLARAGASATSRGCAVARAPVA